MLVKFSLIEIYNIMRRQVSVLWVSSPVFSQLACRFFVTSREVFFLPEVSCFAWALGFHFGPFVVLLEIFGLRTVPIPESQISKSNDAASASASPFIRCWRHSTRIKNHKYHHSTGLCLIQKWCLCR